MSSPKTRPEAVSLVDLLPDHVGGVPVDAEALPVADGVQGGPGGPVVVGDFGGVDLQGELDADLVEDVDDGIEAALPSV